METSLPQDNTMGRTYPDDIQQPSTQSVIPVIAGILLILAGFSGLFTWASALALDQSMLANMLPAETPITAEQLQSILLICGIIGCILSIFALTGGIVALQRKAWGLAVIGSILGLFSIGFLFSGSILSLIGLILLVVSRKDFQ